MTWMVEMMTDFVDDARSIRISIISFLLIVFLLLGVTGCGNGGGGSENVGVSDSSGNGNQSPVSQGWMVSTLAGPTQGPGSFDGTGAAAGFYYPNGITTDGTYLYVADSGNRTIRKVEIASGEVTTLAGSPGSPGSADSTDGTGATARFAYPDGITTDGTYLYVADSGNRTIRKVEIASGKVTTLAGLSGDPGSTDSTDGTGATARFALPQGITINGTFLYIADSRNHTIRKVHISTGITTTLAGSPGQFGAADSSDGTGTTARFAIPDGITTDGTSLYIADSSNHAIRKVDIETGATTTLAGLPGQSGAADSTDGAGATARFAFPTGIMTDGTYIFVGDANHLLRKVAIATGETTTLAGLPGQSGSADSTDGTGATARFYYPVGIAISGPYLYVAEHNHIIRKVQVATGATVTLAGSPRSSGAADSTDDTGATARFDYLQGIATDGTSVFVTDTDNRAIRKVHLANGTTSTLAGALGQFGSEDSTDGTGATARFAYPEGITTNGTHLYVTDAATIREVDILTGATTTLAGSPSTTGYADSTDGTGATARFNFPAAITTEDTFLFVADTNNHALRKVSITTGATTTLAGSLGQAGAEDSTDGTGATARLNRPAGITTDGAYLYVADFGNNTIRKIEIVTGKTTTLAGEASGDQGWADSTDGTGATARFSGPRGLATDGEYLYVADVDNHVIRRVSLTTGEVTTIAGMANRYGTRDGIGKEATFFWPSGVVMLGNAIYVIDTFINNIRKIEYR